jgi:magnesium chelatase subunit I
MSTSKQITTLKALKKSGYKSLSVREEIRKNLISKIRAKEELFPGIIGYDQTVIPQVENAILAGQDIILLGERGQAKSRLIRALVNLLDYEIPYIAGCEINDDPFSPLCIACRDKVNKSGDKVEIAWLSRDERYAEKLATPDIAVADLIGEVDPIRVAEGKYLSDELTIHFGLIPRTNRGIFAINELPDLSERIQVSLFNLMEEKDIQIKGYKVRLPLDLVLVASANPEDYTNRGRIITPLKDRYGAQIRTHYPNRAEDEMLIMEQELKTFLKSDAAVVVPQYMKEVIAEITDLARRSGDINQRSGVSVRVSISNYESIISNAYKRSLLTGEAKAVPRLSDLPAILPTTMGKIELESAEDGLEEKILTDITRRAVLNVFDRYFTVDELEGVIESFKEGIVVETGGYRPSVDYAAVVSEIESLDKPIKQLGPDKSNEAMAAAVEFVLEGLHLKRRLNKDVADGTHRYIGQV